MAEDIFGPDPEPTVPPKTIAVRRRLVQWDEKTGQPIVSTEMVLTKNQIQDAITAAVSQPYHDPENKEPQFAGMTNMEVMLIKMVRSAARTGDSKDAGAILDRILGKPKQTTETTTFAANYQDYLAEIERKGEGAPTSAPVVAPPIDVVPVADEDIFDG